MRVRLVRVFAVKVGEDVLAREVRRRVVLAGVGLDADDEAVLVVGGDDGAAWPAGQADAHDFLLEMAVRAEPVLDDVHVQDGERGSAIPKTGDALGRRPRPTLLP